jgi:hypothetical protein
MIEFVRFSPSIIYMTSKRMRLEGHVAYIGGKRMDTGEASIFLFSFLLFHDLVRLQRITFS